MFREKPRQAMNLRMARVPEARLPWRVSCLELLELALQPHQQLRSPTHSTTAERQI